MILRAAWQALAAFFACLFGFLGTLVAWLLPRRVRVQSAVLRAWGRAVVASSGIRLERRGLERIRGGPFVITPNHASMLDICVLAAALPVELRFVSRPFFFKVPILGWGMRAGGHVALDPRRPRDAARTLGTLGPALARGLSIVLFPEGTRTPDGRLQAYKRGPFLTAIRNGVAVLPVHLAGLHAVLPRGRLVANPGRVVLTVGEPLATEGLDEGDAGGMAKRVEAWAAEQAAAAGA